MAMSNAALEAALKAALQRLVTALANKTAPDSLKIEGKTLAQITTQILEGKAATAGVADNALALGGKDLATLEAERAAQLTAAIEALRNELETSVGEVTKESLGLGNVVNYGVATEAEALDGAADKYVTAFLADKIAQAKIDELVGASPETLNTIHEIAAALNNDPDVINTMMTLIGTKETPEGAQAKADAARDAAVVAAATEADSKIAAAIGSSEEATDSKIAAAASSTLEQASLDATAKADAAEQAAIDAAAIDAQAKADAAVVTANTYTDSGLATKLGKDEQAADAAKLGGKTLAEVIADAQSGVDMSNVVQKTDDFSEYKVGEQTFATLLADLAAGADLATLQASFNAFVAAKASDTDMLEGTDDAKYTTARAVNYAIEAAISALVGTAPEALDTIQKLAAALQNNPDALTALQTMVGQNADRITALEAKVGTDTATVLADAKAYTDAEVAALEAVVDTKLDKTAQAVDSAMLEGQSLAQVTAARDAAIAAAVAPVVSDLEALIIELTGAFDQAATDLEGPAGV